MPTIRRTAERHVALFPCGIWICCVAPRSSWPCTRIAAVVHCRRATPVRVVRIILWISVRLVRRIRRPLLTRPSIHRRTQCSHVLDSLYGLFTFWTKHVFTCSVKLSRHACIMYRVVKKVISLSVMGQYFRFFYFEMTLPGRRPAVHPVVGTKTCRPSSFLYNFLWTLRHLQFSLDFRNHSHG